MGIFDDFKEVPVPRDPQEDTAGSLMQGYEEIPVVENSMPDYVPQVLRGTEYEYEADTIKKKISEQGGFDLGVELDAGKLAWSLETYKNLDPDTASKVQKIADSQGVAFSNVAVNSEEYLEWEKANEVYKSLFATDDKDNFIYPSTVKSLTDPSKMAQAKDDIDTLTKIEGVLRNSSSGYEKAGYAFLEGAKGLGQSLANFERSVLDYVSDKTAKGEIIHPATVGTQFLFSLLQDEVKDVSDSLKDIPAFTPIPIQSDDKVEQFAYDFMQMLPQVGGSILAGLAAGPLGAGAFSGMYIQGATYGELRDKGVSTERANAAAYSNAILQGGLDAVGFSKLLSAFKATGAKNVVKNFLGAAVVEGFTEFLQAFPESAALIWGEAEKTGATPQEQVDLFVQNLPETSLQGLYEGMLVAPISLLGASVKLPADFRKLKQLNADYTAWEYLTGLSKESKLRKRNPEEFEKKVAQDMDSYNIAPNLYLDTDIVEQYFQDEKSLRKFLKDMNAEEKYDSAKEAGTELELSKARWMAKFAGTEESLALAKDIRFDQGGITLNERTEKIKEAIDSLKDLHNEYNQSLKDIKYPEEVTNMRKTLIDSGISANEADASLSILLAGAKVFSKYTGETNAQWFKRVQPFIEVSDKEGPKGATSMLKDGKVKIELFKNANRSTLVHEITHLFVKEMEYAVAQNKGEDPILLADYENLKKFAGGKFDQDGQEKIATAFEEYAREGRSPSISLEDSFNKFREWLTATYKSVNSFETGLNEGVKEIFDRWLASEADIEEAYNFYGEKQSLVNLMKDIDEKEKNNIIAKKEKAKKKAVNAQINKAIKRYYEVNNGRAGLKAEAKRNVDNSSLYTAINRAKELGGVDPDEISSYLSDEDVKILKKKHPGFVGKYTKTNTDKAYKTYHSLVLSYGGINPGSVLPSVRKEHFGKDGASAGVFRKTGRGLDQVAQELENDGYLNVPIDRNADDYLLELLISKEKYIDPDEAFRLEVEQPIEFLSLTELAMEVGYESPELLIDDVLKAKRYNKAVKIETKNVANDLEQRIKEEVTRRETVNGDEAYHNDKQFDYLLSEAKSLEKLVKKDLTDVKKDKTVRSTDAKVIRSTAKNIIADKTVREATAYRSFSYAEKRHGTKAFEAMKKGDYEEALKYRKLQLLNHALIQESVMFRNELNKIDARYKTKKLMSRINNSEGMFSAVAANIAFNYELNTSVQVAKKIPKELPSIESLDLLLYEQTPEWIVNLQKAGSYKDLTVAELKSLDETIQSILHFGRKELSTIKDQKIKELKDYVASVKEYAQYLPNFNYDASNPLNKVETFASMGRMTEFMAERLDNFSRIRTKDVKVKDQEGNTVVLKAEGKAGPSLELFRESDTREGVYESVLKPTHDKTRKDFDVLRRAFKRLNQEFNASNRKTFDLPNFPIPENMRRAGFLKWDAEKMVSFLLNMGNEGNIEAMSNAYGFSEEKMKEMASYFTKKELKAIQNIWDATESLYPKLAETYYKIYNKPMSKVDAKEITLNAKDGEITLRGGYYPLVFDRRVALFTEQKSGKSAFGHLDAETIEDIAQNRRASMLRSVKTNDKFTIDRVQGHALPPKLSLGVWFEHIADVSRYISHAEYTRDLQKIMNNKEWQQVVYDKLGPDNLKRLKEWAAYQALPERRNIEALDGAWDSWRQRTAATYLLFKFGTGFKQRLALFSGISEIGAKWVLKGFKKTNVNTSVFGMTNNEQYQAVINKSAFMRTRGTSIDREMRTLAYSFDPNVKSFSIGDREVTLKDIQTILFGWLEVNDRAVNTPVWYGGYEKSMFETKDSGLSLEERDKMAVRSGDDAVRRIQSTTRPTDLSAAQRSEGMLRWITIVASWSLKFGNRKGEFYRAWRQGHISIGDFVRHNMLEVLVPSVAGVMLSGVLSGQAPDDPVDYVWETVQNILGGNIATDIAIGAVRFNKTPEFALFEPIKRGGQALKTIQGAVQGKKDVWDVIWDLTRVAEWAVGIPVTNLIHEAYRVQKNLDDKK